jgi:hypothetical protein
MLRPVLRVGLKVLGWCWVALACVSCGRGTAPSASDAAPERAASVGGPETARSPGAPARDAPAASPAERPGVAAPATSLEASTAPVASSADAAPFPGAPAAPLVAAARGAPPARGCRIAQELTLRDDVARAWAASGGSEPQFLVLRADRRKLEWWRGNPPALHGARSLGVPIARLSLLRDRTGGGFSLVFVDDRAALARVRYEAEQFGAPQPLAADADRRFDPALAPAGGRLLVAFTRSVDESMHTFVLRPDEPSAAALDVTPAGHGAAAPSFVLGAEPPILVMIDARGGVSPLLELPFDGAGKPGAVIVRTPVSQPYAPPALSAVAVPGGELEVAFTAIGKLAATAIGRVPLRRAVAPTALHPSRGYGQLSLSSARGVRAVVHALEVPSDASQTAPHQIELKWIDAQGEGEGLTLPALPDSARQPSLVALRRGVFALAFTRGKHAYALLLDCGD